MNINIRRAILADVPAMSRVLIDSITELCVTDHRDDEKALAAWTANKSEAGVAKTVANPDLRVFVAELDGEIAAVGAVDTSGKIGLNYVAPTARFRGVSKALLHRLEQELLALGFEEGHLEATETARRFYRSAGWLENGPQATSRTVNGYPMRKLLTASG
ncbi:GNAT family N-acetyltransferase [Devosia sp. BK]|jgi:GNAT superfamily N-acetyltransferase|uniref:GNAT family N-acetyltransferase n=1 Tax=Devosia sp. BK TaxID=2871706 RepID=UPI00293A01B4|nr:GNAT family N-acetyltransferase [Devosia sp. BK]MDV3252308.1 GNAT family N-acetyltransferase [Devosia sp. BK]